MVKVEFSSSLKSLGINLQIATIEIRDYSVKKTQCDLSSYFNSVAKIVKEKYNLENIKEQKLIRLYRKFYWEHLNIDPTKTRPAAEALIRRILANKPIPQISPFVDAYNWASIQSLVPMGAYDLETVLEPISIRLSEENEKFAPIAQTPKILPPGILITADAQGKILCQYPFRDSQETMIQESTRNIILIAYGIEGFEESDLLASIQITKKNLELFMEHSILSLQFGDVQLWKN